MDENSTTQDKKMGKNQIAGMTLKEIEEFLFAHKSSLPYGYKLPYMQWYEENFLGSSGVREMDNIEEWMYRQLLAKAWVSKNAPYLPNDTEVLKRLSGCRDTKLWDKHSPIVLSMFNKTQDGKEFFHPRQLIDYSIQISKIASNIQNGKKGGRKKTEPISNPLETVRLPTDNQSPSHIELELDLETKQEPESEEDENDSLDFEDGQENEMKIKKELQAVCAGFGVKAGGYQSTWEEVQALGVVHSVGAVVRDFEEWMQEYRGDDFPQGAVSKYLHVAAARLGADSVGSTASAKSPEVVSLARELAYVSDGVLSFGDKQRIRLAEVLKEFPAPEILAAFKIWLGDQDLSDPKNVSFLPGKFVQIADGLCYSARRKKQEADAAKIVRDAAVQRLQAEAEADRARQEDEKQKESEIFDPLA